MKGPNWKGIIRSPCPVSSLNETLLRVIRDRVFKLTIVVRTGDKPWFDDRYFSAHRAKQKAYRVWSRSITQANWEGYRDHSLKSIHGEKQITLDECTKSTEVVVFS